MGKDAPGPRKATYPSPSGLALGIVGRHRSGDQMALDCEGGLLSVLGSKGPGLALVGGGRLFIKLST